MTTTDKAYIYGLLDPYSRKVRYIGKTKHYPEIRLKQHIKSISRSPVNRWIQALLARDLWPIVHVLCEVGLDSAADKEKHWIAKGRENGWPLLNASDGGEGCHEYTIRRICVKLDPKTSRRLGEQAEKMGEDDVREVAAFGISKWLELVEFCELCDKAKISLVGETTRGAWENGK